MTSGAVREDAAACLKDAGADEVRIAFVDEALAVFGGKNREQLFSSMRKGYSLLYLAPGSKVPVWPYESAFLSTESGSSKRPILFRSRCAIDVEGRMREAGVMPRTANREPCDSIWDELSFMSYLYGCLGKALCENCENDAEVWRSRISDFWTSHMAGWMFDFMDKTGVASSRLSFGEEYAALASVGEKLLEVIQSDAEGLGR